MIDYQIGKCELCGDECISEKLHTEYYGIDFCGKFLCVFVNNSTILC